jgi:DNA-directed RNA polymerase subunit RPC12/RpoP
MNRRRTIGVIQIKEVEKMQRAAMIEKKQPRNSNKNHWPSDKQMPVEDTYLQNCPICGRPLFIALEYRGRRVNCRHCGGKFIAVDPSNPCSTAQNASNALVRRADRLLELCARKLRLRAAG